MNKPYQHMLLKLLGEIFGGGKLGVNPVIMSGIAKEIAAVVSGGTQVAVMVDGGDRSRGAELSNDGMVQNRADYMDMLGTVTSAIILQDFLEKGGIHTHVQSVISMAQMAEPCVPHHAERHLKKGRLVIFGAGSGMPYLSTDTVTTQRALRIGTEALLMGKQGMDGVYDSGPYTNPEARRCEHLTHDEFLSRGLKVADVTAIVLAHDNALSIIFLNLSEQGDIGHVVQGEPIGTFVFRWQLHQMKESDNDR